MDDFFSTVASRWPAGREDLHWHILPDTALIEEQLVGPYREMTHGVPGVEPVPAEWVHVTLLHSGPAEEFSAVEIDQVIAEVRTACASISPFSMTFDRPSPGRVAIECAAYPGRPARELWQLVGDVTSRVTGNRYPVVPDVYYPHASLAYATATLDHRPMKAWLSDNVLAPVTLPVSRISVVAQRHDLRRITWRHIADVDLAAPRG